MTQMSLTERSQVYTQATNAIAENNWDTAMELMKTVPLSPEMAKIAKQVFGADYLKNSSFDLSAAEEAYGHGWLNR